MKGDDEEAKGRAQVRSEHASCLYRSAAPNRGEFDYEQEKLLGVCLEINARVRRLSRLGGGGLHLRHSGRVFEEDDVGSLRRKCGSAKERGLKTEEESAHVLDELHVEISASCATRGTGDAQNSRGSRGRCGKGRRGSCRLGTGSPCRGTPSGRRWLSKRCGAGSERGRARQLTLADNGQSERAAHPRAEVVSDVRLCGGAKNVQDQANSEKDGSD